MRKTAKKLAEEYLQVDMEVSEQYFYDDEVNVKPGKVIKITIETIDESEVEQC